MTDRLELRGFRTRVRGSTLVATKGYQSVEVPLDTITSVLWARVNRLPAGVLRFGVLLILLPWAIIALGTINEYHVVLIVFSNVAGLGLIIAYHTLHLSAIDIEGEGGNYLVTGKREELKRLRRRIDAFRTRHGQREAVEEDRALDSDIDVYDRVDSSTPEKDVSMYDDIDACVRCGSTNLGMASIAEGGIPGVFDISGQIVCRNCGLVAPALSFDSKEDHEAHVAALKEEGKIDAEGEWIPGSDAEEAQR